MARLKDYYKSEVVPAMMKQFGYSNTMQVPRLEKIIVNMGLGEAIQNVKILESAAAEIGALTGQKPVITKARKSIATFKLRKGMSIGCMVTLRKERMYEFFDRLVNVALPRIRDFRGIPPSSFDGRGNFAMGIKEQFIFPEIDYDKIDKVKGMNVVIVTTARTDEEARHLLKLMGMPFRN
jgi:large subunit ribosomal protein L5